MGCPVREQIESKASDKAHSREPSVPLPWIRPYFSFMKQLFPTHEHESSAGEAWAFKTCDMGHAPDAYNFIFYVCFVWALGSD